MNKTYLIIACAAVVLLLAGGVFLLLGNSKSSTPSTQKTGVETQTSANTTPADSLEKTSLKALMSGTTNQQCTFTDTESGSSGTVYVSGGKFRGDFNSQVNGVVQSSHMISDGQEVYVWMDALTSGFKMSMAAIDKTPNSGQKTVDVNKQVDYSCKPGSVDASRFSLPTEIKFEDVSAVAADGPISLPSGAGSNVSCSACDNLPESSKAQCKATLKCS